MNTKKTSLSAKVKQTAQFLREELKALKPLKKGKISEKPKTPDLSPANAIERISKMLRKEVQELEKKKASGL